MSTGASETNWARGVAAVFLDRDDTLVPTRELTAGTDHEGDLFDPKVVRLLPGVGEGLSRLYEAGFALVIVSNQGCVARGRCSRSEVDATNERVVELIRGYGSEVAGVYVCPFNPRGSAAPWNVEHPWRKPAPGMFLAAAGDLGLDLGSSWMIGDTERDRTGAVRAGIAPERCLLVGDGHEFGGVADAAERILHETGSA